MFCRPKKMGECVYVRHREKMFIPHGASLRVCVNAGHCTGLMGAESGPHRFWIPPGTCGISEATSWRMQISKCRAQGPGAPSSLSCLYLPAFLHLGLLPLPKSSQLPGIHRKHFVYLEFWSAMQAGQTHIFRDVKGTSIWVAIIFRSEESRYSLGCILSLQGTHGAIGKTARAVLGYRFVLRARWCYASCRTIWCKSRVLTIPRYTDHCEHVVMIHKTWSSLFLSF